MQREEGTRRLSASSRLDWTYPGHWRRLWQTGELPACTNMARFAEGHITITVVALTPLRS